MSINNMRFLSLLAALALSACSSDLFLTHNGNMPSNERIAKVKVGQTKNDVISTLGALSSDIKRVAFMAPKEVNRDVLTIEFSNNGKVEKISRLNKKNGVEVEVCDDKTETLGHQPGFFQKFFGGVGNYSPFPAARSDI